MYLVLAIFAVAGACTPSAFGQRLDGTLRGTVADQSGAIVPNVKVTATNEATGIEQTVDTSSAGIYLFPNLLVGSYTVTVKAAGFSTYTRKNVAVASNQVIEANVSLSVGAATTTVEVTAGSEVVQTTSSQLSNTFDAQMTQLPMGQVNGNVLALAALAPNTTLMGSGVLGQGGSVGGTRPRMNGFQVDGVDNNDVMVTGPQMTPIQDSVQEFQLITNQFSAEYGHSAGGQFNVITKSGTNEWHGEGHEYNVNRNFLSMDNLEKATLTEPRRFDRNRLGGSLGGPVVRRKVFIFGAYEYNNRGSSASSVSVLAPTAAGLTALNGMAANQAVKDILAHFPVAPASDGKAHCKTDPNDKVPELYCINRVAIPVGLFQAAAPDYFNQHEFNVNGDINLSKHSIRMRYLYGRFRSPNQNADLPIAEFTGAAFNDNQKAILTDVWTISNRWVNDIRFSFSRNINGFGIPTQFSNFPNAEIDNLTLDVGPDPNSPQGGGQNTYQVSDSMSYVHGTHTFKWGVEGRATIAPSDFLPRARGEWDYANLQTFINDLVPDGLNGALRGAGSGFFAGNQKALYWFAQDDWKVSRKLTLNLGVRYEWNGNPRDAALQKLNSIASVPGIVQFGVPRDDKNNFGPHVGFAYDPFGNGKWAIRGGFSLSYDVTFQNLTLLQLPPQLQSEQNPALTCSGAAGTPPAWCTSGPVVNGKPTMGPGFLAGGGLAQINVPPTTAGNARSATQSLIVDTKAPEVYTWSLSVQHEVWKNAGIEARYLGTHSLFLPIQTRLNSISIFENGFKGLPTFASQTTAQAATFTGTSLTRQDALNTEDLRYSAQGFDGGFITAFEPAGSGYYHSASVDFTQRMTRGLFLRANYTFAKNIDNSTNELFSSRVNPRRPQNAYNTANERGRSVLDIHDKFALSWIYQTPKIDSDNAFLKYAANNWEYSATFIAQSGQPITALSGVDWNGNLDSAGDRAFVNPGGAPLTGTNVGFVCFNRQTGATFTAGSIGNVKSDGTSSGCGQGQAVPTPNPNGTVRTVSGNNFVVGYYPLNPNAQFIVSQLGALPINGTAQAGRNTISTPGVNIWNMSVNKRFPIFGESRYLDFTVNAFNVFNHRNFSLVNLDVFQNNTNGLSTSYANVSSANFLNAHQFNGGRRTLQLGLKFVF